MCKVLIFPAFADNTSASAIIVLDIDFSKISDVSKLSEYRLFKDNNADWYIENGSLFFTPSEDGEMFYCDISEYRNSVITVEFTQNLYIPGKDENHTGLGLSQNDTAVFTKSLNNSTLMYTKGNFNGDVRFQSSYDNIKNGCDTIKCVNTEDLCYAEDDGSYLANADYNTCVHRIRDFKFVLNRNDFISYYKDPVQNEFIPFGGSSHQYSVDYTPTPECYFDSCDKYKYSYLEYLPNRIDMNYLAWYGLNGDTVQLSRIKITVSPYNTFKALSSDNTITFTFDDVFPSGTLAYLNGEEYELSEYIKYDRVLNGYLQACKTDSYGKHTTGISSYSNTPYTSGSLLTLNLDTLTGGQYTLSVPADTITQDGLTLGKELTYTFNTNTLRSDTTLLDFDSTYSSQLPSVLKSPVSDALTLDGNNNIAFTGNENDYFYLYLPKLGNDILTVEMTMDGGFRDCDTRFFAGLGTSPGKALDKQLFNQMWMTAQNQTKFIFANSVSFNNWQREIDGTVYTNKTFLNISEDFGSFNITMKLYPKYWTAQYSYGNIEGQVNYGLYLNKNVVFSADRILEGSTLVPEANTHHLMDERINPEFLAFGFSKGENINAKISHLRVTRNCTVGGSAEYLKAENKIVYTFPTALACADDIYITDGTNTYVPHLETMANKSRMVYHYTPETQKSSRADYRTITGTSITMQLEDDSPLNKNYKLVIPATAKTLSGINMEQTYTIDCFPLQNPTEYTVFDYDISTNPTAYDTAALKNMNNVSISADKNGLSILNTNQDFKYWAAVPLKDIGSNAIHLKADLSIQNNELNNIFFGLTDGSNYRLDSHNNETNGTLLHIMNIFYNAANSECNSQGNTVYALSGANNGWTSKSNTGLGANQANFNNKIHGMKHIAVFDNSALDDICVDIILTPYGWSGTLSVGENSQYIDYTPYSYAYGKAWYKLWNTPANLVISTKINGNTNPNVFKKLSVSLLPYENFSIKGNTIYTSFDEQLLENAVIEDSSGIAHSFTVSPWEETASWVNAGGDGGAVKTTVLGTKISITDPMTSEIYKIIIPYNAKNIHGVTLKKSFVHTFMFNEAENIFAFDRYNTLCNFSPDNSMTLTPKGVLEIRNPHTISVGSNSKNILKVDFECTPENNYSSAFTTQSGNDIFRITADNYNNSCITKLITPSEVAAISYGTSPSLLCGEIYIYPDCIKGYVQTNSESFAFTDFSQGVSGLESILTASGITFDKLTVTEIPNISILAKYDHTQNTLTYTVNTPLASSAHITVSDGENNYPLSVYTDDAATKIVVALEENTDMTKAFTLYIPSGTLTADGEALTSDISYSFTQPHTEILSFSCNETSLETVITYRLVDNNSGEYIESGHIALVGMYDANDKLIAAYNQKMNPAQLYKITFTPPSKPDYIKLFMWKDFKTMLPLSDYLYHN